MSDITTNLIDRLVEAVHTGEHCGTSDAGPRRYAAISIRGFDLLYKHGVLAEAMRRVAEIEKPHPRAQQRFVAAWVKNTGILFRERVCDDEACFAGLRVLLPPYQGPAVTLLRGQLAEDPLGVSWTTDYVMALVFTLYGCTQRVPAIRNVFKPVKGLTLRRNAVMVRATIPPDQIISALEPHFPSQNEYVVDPRRLRLQDIEIDTGEPQ